MKSVLVKILKEHNPEEKQFVKILHLMMPSARGFTSLRGVCGLLKELLENYVPSDL